MKYDSMEQAVKANLNGTIYIARTVEEPCGPCYLGAIQNVEGVYNDKDEALQDASKIFEPHKDEEWYILEVIKADVDADGDVTEDFDPIENFLGPTPYDED